jgi:hypothetical protein
LDPPRDGDRGSREEGMIAEVIPLRRRTPGHGSSSDEEPAHSGLFDPPQDPEPPEEYSVWERPTAELLRRERSDDLVPSRSGERRRGMALRNRRARAVAILATLVASVALIIVTADSQRTPHSPTSAGLGGIEAGLGAPLGGVPQHAKPSRARRSVLRSKRTSTYRSRSATSTYRSATARTSTAPRPTSKRP